MKVRKKKRLPAQGENKDLYQRAVFEMRIDGSCEMVVAGEITDKKGRKQISGCHYSSLGILKNAEV